MQQRAWHNSALSCGTRAQTARLHELSRRCSPVARLTSIGKSVEGSDLWALEIGDKAMAHLPRPAFRYVGNMHGDEPSGR